MTGPLQCIDRLEVGPVTIESRKLSARYLVHQGLNRSERELVYKYERDVFDPDDLGSRNLAGMVVSQAALNYGLFCKEIVFRGPFDEVDRAFFQDMGRNTNREIWVNKILMPNPFLVPEKLSIPREEAPSITGADWVFPDLQPAIASGPWFEDCRRPAVLSSGGKESLLTFGLLQEMGLDPCPIYINESGRHWFTALNAHRAFQSQVPGTERVWTNIDRLYNWMLQHLPFVRQDFGSVRADQYPIRLWTVAGLVFGALPLMRARGIGRLVIGDEYDTTLRLTFKGLSHYGGLYDQSRYFDNALSRYFSKKGWGINQFSVLRPLSELLIQQMLAERYPELHQHQVSCHAAHMEKERALPCGRCEKCRRVVGMHLAVGLNPSHCGYTPAQVEGALAALQSKDVHQEAVTAEHVLYLLSKQGRLPQSPPASRSARPHPEVMKLRFDSERSPYDSIPRDLREPLYRIYVSHAQGSVGRSERAWVEIDPFSAESLSVPYRFDSTDAKGKRK